MTEIPEFDAALERTAEFLIQHSYPEEPLWVFREDFVFSGGSYRLRVPLPSDTRAMLRGVYERGRGLGFG